MSLAKQLVHLNMRGGIDTKRDDRLVIPSKLLDLRDAVFDDADTIVTRGGLTSQALTTVGFTPAVASPARLATNLGTLLIEDATGLRRVLKDSGQALVKADDKTLTGYNFTRAGMTTRAVSGNIEKWPTTATPNHAGQMDCAYGDGYSCWAWEERDTNGSGRMGVRVLLYDESNDTTVASYYKYDNTTSNIFTSPRVVYSPEASVFCVFVGQFSSGAATFSVISTVVSPYSVPSSLSWNTVMTEATLGGATGSSGSEVLLDALFDGDADYFLAVRRNSTSQRDVTFYRVSGNDGYTILTSGTFTYAAKPTSLTLGFVDDVRVACFTNNANTVRAVLWTAGTGFGTEKTVATGAASTSVGRIVVCSYSSTDFGIIYENSSTASFASPPTAEVVTRVATRPKDLSSTSSEGAAFHGWLIHSRAVQYNSRYYMGFFNPSDTQPTTFLVDVQDYLDGLYVNEVAPLVVARIDYGECGYLRNDWHTAGRVPTTFTVSTSITMPYPRWVADAQLVAGKYVQPVQIHRADIDFGDQLGQAEVNGLTYLAGACPHTYDGRVLVEEGFHHAPEIYSLTAVTTGTGNLFGSLPAGAYRITCTVAWQDARGNWWESAPADPVSVTTSVGNLDVSAVFGVPPTRKEGYQILWYRTIVGASSGPFYRAFDQTGTTITSDATLVDCEQLYTVPGVAGQALVHDPMPACRHIENHQGRLVASGVGDGYRLAYSNVVQFGRAPEFNALLFKLTNYEFGRTVASQSQDGKLAVFGERNIGVLLGQGPDDTGAADGFSEVEVVVNDMGMAWNSPRAIATTNEGVWFRSSYGGLRLFGRNNAVARSQDGKHLGSEVDSELLSSYTVNAVQGTNKQQVRFYHSGGGVLVYDTLWGQWSRFTNHTHVDAAFAEGRFYHITTTPTLLYYNESAFTDNGTAITMYGKTPFLQFAGIQGFQRVTRVMFLGNPVDASSDTQVFTLQMGVDFTSTLTTVVKAQDVAVAEAGRTQIEVQPTYQKCEALQIVFQFKSKAAASRFRLTDVTLQVGVKQGRFKMGASQRY